MADSSVIGLTEDTAPTADDVIYVVSDPAGTPLDRKVALGNLGSALVHVRDYARASRNTGNVTLNGTAWGNVDTATDLVLTAATGDVIEICPQARVAAGAASTDTHFDVATVVGGSPVNYFGTAGGVSDEGLIGWRCKDTVDTSFAGSAFRTLVSGDLSSGTVTLRLRYRQDSAGNRLFVAGATNPFSWVAKNLGPAT